jgi:hypothetical protein
MYSPLEIIRVGTGPANGSFSAGAQCSSCSSDSHASSSREPGNLWDADILSSSHDEELRWWSAHRSRYSLVEQTHTPEAFCMKLSRSRVDANRRWRRHVPIHGAVSVRNGVRRCLSDKR